MMEWAGFAPQPALETCALGELYAMCVGRSECFYKRKAE